MVESLMLIKKYVDTRGKKLKLPQNCRDCWDDTGMQFSFALDIEYSEQKGLALIQSTQAYEQLCCLTVKPRCLLKENIVLAIMYSQLPDKSFHTTWF